MKWLKTQAEVPDPDPPSFRRARQPHELRVVYQAVTKVLESLAVTDSGLVLTFHLSPGTPAMTVVWILLASSRFRASLIQSSPERGVGDVALPFDIASEFVPDFVNSSKKMASLSEGLPPAAPAFVSRSSTGADHESHNDRARRAASWDVNVLVEGETGTGKELFAKAIHETSTEGSGPYVAVNCGAIPGSLIESELFGHEKAPSPAPIVDTAVSSSRRIEDHCFLDEVGELPPSAQVKLLRILQTGEVTRVGGSERSPATSGSSQRPTAT